MPEIPEGILIGVIVVAGAWLLAVLATVWLFHTASERRERIRQRLLKIYFRGLPGESKDPRKERARRKLFLTQVGAQLLGDFLLLAVLVPVGWLVVGGAEGETAGLALVMIVAPLVAFHPYIIILVYVLTLHAER